MTEGGGQEWYFENMSAVQTALWSVVPRHDCKKANTVTAVKLSTVIHMQSVI